VGQCRLTCAQLDLAIHTAQFNPKPWDRAVSGSETILNSSRRLKRLLFWRILELRKGKTGEPKLGLWEPERAIVLNEAEPSICKAAA